METSNNGIYVAKKTHFSRIPEIHGDGSASNILGKFRTTGFARSCTTRIRKGGATLTCTAPFAHVESRWLLKKGGGYGA